MTIESVARRLPIGADTGEAGTHFRVWAPRRQRVVVVIEGTTTDAEFELESEAGGYFAGFVAEATAGTLYRYRLDSGDRLFPDPASRFQPTGPHGPSQIIDPTAFRWTDSAWKGLPIKRQVIYEMHVGTFTPAGTWGAATEVLPALADVGVTVLEVMPVADFPGRFGWGYDGVNMFAPTRLYGTPDDFRHFVDTAHSLGLAVILDVVYNHFGPDGNYIGEFSRHFFSDRYDNEWGDALDFEGPRSAPVREFFLANARYWVDEFHIDGLRLDATQQIFDETHRHIVAEIATEIRDAARGRHTIVVAENEPQDARLIRPISAGGMGLDALWNDDFHHSAVVALTGRREAYYSPHFGTPQEFISAAKYGFLYQGQRYSWQNDRRGQPGLDLPAHAFVTFMENHDQVANTATGARLRQQTSPGSYRAITALTLLGPSTPMLFQGQEFGSTAPFLYFADHEPDLAAKVREGRARFLSQFPSVAAPDVTSRLADPADPKTFERSKLDPGERERNVEAVTLHRDLLRLRHSDPVLALQGVAGLDGAVLSATGFVLRFFAPDGQDRLLLVNLGVGTMREPAPEPLLAPPANSAWRIAWSSEDPQYGGGGTPQVETDKGWWLPAEAAVFLVPRNLRHQPDVE